MTSDQGTKQFLLRIPVAMAADLEQAKWSQHMDMTEIVLQGLALRLYAIAPGRLFEILERVGYESKQKPGRPVRAAAEPEAESGKEQVREDSGTDSDPWSLEAGSEMSTIQSSNV